jgi:hypothetical protein
MDPRGEIGRLGLCEAVQRQRHCYDHGLLRAISILLHGAVPCIGCAAFVMVLMQRLDANHALFDSCGTDCGSSPQLGTPHCATPTGH